MQIDVLKDFADGGQCSAQITAEVVKQVKELVVSVYANKGDTFEGHDICKHRVYTLQVNSAEAPTSQGDHMNNISNARHWQLQSTRVTVVLGWNTFPTPQ